MMKKGLLLGMLVVVLTFGIMFVSCDSGGGDTDTWTNVTSLIQLNGIWKGSGGGTITEEGYTYKVTYTEITMTISATNENSGTRSVYQKTILSNMNINTYNSLKSDLSGPKAPENVTFNDSAHTITIISTDSHPQPITLTDMNNTHINQNGTKIKLRGDGDLEVILIKQ